jgi:hypothetical protein
MNLHHTFIKSTQARADYGVSGDHAPLQRGHDIRGSHPRPPTTPPPVPCGQEYVCVCLCDILNFQAIY